MGTEKFNAIMNRLIYENISDHLHNSNRQFTCLSEADKEDDFIGGCLDTTLYTHM